MSLASKAKLAALYYSCKLAAPLWTTLEELSHFQPTPTLITTNNITAQGLTMGTMTPKASKSMDQHFHWLKCWNAQRQFQYPWRKGILNPTYYSKKNHAPKHHQNVCPFFVLTILYWKNYPNTVTKCFLPSVDLTHECIYPPIGVNYNCWFFMPSNL